MKNHQSIDIIIMAAGRGTRMKSKLPKVLHPLGGRPLLTYVLEKSNALQARKIVVTVGHEAEKVSQFVENYATQNAKTNIECVVQYPQLGTGHAAKCALTHLQEDGLTLILSGDVPLISTSTLQKLVGLATGENLVLLTLDTSSAEGYGRILRDKNNEIIRIVEHKDASAAQREIREVYSGILIAPTKYLQNWVLEIDNNNAQSEYYLTDIVRLAVQNDVSIISEKIYDSDEVAGVNTPAQLAALERAFQMTCARSLMEQGVQLSDPHRIDIRGMLSCGHDVSIDINCLFEGDVILGDFVKIGANCVIVNAQIAAYTEIKPFTHIEGDVKGIAIGENSIIGPFAHLRPGTKLGRSVHIGNFVEVKNSHLGDSSKANHLAYLGDASVGDYVNYGAGAITANYDGAHKHLTVIESHVHIGSNSVLVAPVTIAESGTVAAGSVITKNTAAGSLSITRAKQISILDWLRPSKKK
jgi:bifunctional UDP-N-acetylglucosamine pyrophosphorylase / glucosamine-1-phosphate N-acetyltransferase